MPGKRWEIPDRARSPKGLHETKIQKAEIRKAGIRKIVGIAEKIVHGKGPLTLTGRQAFYDFCQFMY